MYKKKQLTPVVKTLFFYFLLNIYDFPCQFFLFSVDLHFTVTVFLQSWIDIDSKMYSFLLQLSTRLFNESLPIKYHDTE